MLPAVSSAPICRKLSDPMRVLCAFPHFRAVRPINQGDDAGRVQSRGDFGGGLARRRRVDAAVRFEQQPLELKCDIFGGVEPHALPHGGRRAIPDRRGLFAEQKTIQRPERIGACQVRGP